MSLDIFRCGRGLPHERVGAKKFSMSLKTREIRLFWRDIPGFCQDISEIPEKFEKKNCVFNSRPLLSGTTTRSDYLLSLAAETHFDVRKHISGNSRLNVSPNAPLGFSWPLAFAIGMKRGGGGRVGRFPCWRGEKGAGGVEAGLCALHPGGLALGTKRLICQPCLPADIAECTRRGCTLRKDVLLPSKHLL